MVPECESEGKRGMMTRMWVLWCVPVAAWTVYMSWLTGYHSGYDSGHDAGWNVARTALMPKQSAISASTSASLTLQQEESL